jgi:hypothetical protein
MLAQKCRRFQIKTNDTSHDIKGLDNCELRARELIQQLKDVDTDKFLALLKMRGVIHYEDMPKTQIGVPIRIGQLANEAKKDVSTAKCSHCGKQGSNTAKLLCCGRCAKEFYCSAKCQKTRWPQHKPHCDGQVLGFPSAPLAPVEPPRIFAVRLGDSSDNVMVGMPAESMPTFGKSTDVKDSSQPENKQNGANDQEDDINDSEPTDALECNHCSKPGKAKELKLCSRCMTVRYCSTDCQRAAWKAGHKTACKTD